MNALILRAVLATALLCTVTGLVLLHLQERRHDREMLRAEENRRLAGWQQVTGIPPPGHLDWETSLSDDELAALNSIAAGLTILDGTEGDRA